VTRRLALVIWGAMMLVPLLFLAVADAVRWPSPLGADTGLLFGVTLAASALFISLAHLLPPSLPSSSAGPGATVLVRMLVGWALCEAAALFPLMAWIVTGDQRLLGVCAVDLAALLTLFPREARWAGRHWDLPSQGGR
jgi:hypothetical protein